jgi:CHAD domain-containing protein
MPRYEKWLSSAAADAPADEVARSAVAERLLAVSFFLKKAIGGDDEAEVIHQLRVWTRRAATALSFFEPGLPRRGRERMLKMLHELRHVAGQVRDCDVQRERLEDTQQNIPRRAIRSLKKDRRKARKGLKKLRRHLRCKDRLQLEIEKLLEKISWPKHRSRRVVPPFGAVGRQQLATLASPFFAGAKKNLRVFDNLHQLRIAGKQLRYALELAAPIVAARPLRQLYDGLNDAQDRLGVVCDEKALVELARQWLEETTKIKPRQRLEKLLAAQEQRYQLAHKKLLRWWSPARLRGLQRLWNAVVK